MNSFHVSVNIPDNTGKVNVIGMKLCTASFTHCLVKGSFHFFDRIDMINQIIFCMIIAANLVIPVIFLLNPLNF